MIEPRLIVFITAVSLVLALDKTDTDSSYSEEYVADVDPVWGRGVFAFLNDLSHGRAISHSFPPDYSLERADKNENRPDYLNIQNQETESETERETEVSNGEYPRRETKSDVEPSHLNLRKSLTLWDNVERRLRNLLLSAQQSPKLTLKDRGTHSAAVMTSVIGLASKLLESCSTSQYVKSYRETVSSNLLQAFAMPVEISNKLLEFLGKLRKSVSSVRAHLLRDNLPCRQTDYSNRCPSSPQLNREKQLIQALGSLARTVLASRSLQRAVNNFDEVSYLLNGQRDTTLYVLSVKAARVLKLLTNKYTCDLPLASQLHRMMNESLDEDSPNRLHHGTSLQHRYPLLIG